MILKIEKPSTPTFRRSFIYFFICLLSLHLITYLSRCKLFVSPSWRSNINIKGKPGKVK